MVRPSLRCRRLARCDQPACWKGTRSAHSGRDAYSRLVNGLAVASTVLQKSAQMRLKFNFGRMIMIWAAVLLMIAVMFPTKDRFAMSIGAPKRT